MGTKETKSAKPDETTIEIQNTKWELFQDEKKKKKMRLMLVMVGIVTVLVSIATCTAFLKHPPMSVCESNTTISESACLCGPTICDVVSECTDGRNCTSSTQSALERWSGKQNNIWLRTQCPWLKNFYEIPREECKKKCEDTETCTAINYNPTIGACSLRACTHPVQAPKTTLADSRGYYILVSFDCTLSSWSDWSVCSASCGGGFQSRYRRVLQEAMHGGKECEVQRSQEQQCAQEKCPPFAGSGYPNQRVQKVVEPAYIKYFGAGLDCDFQSFCNWTIHSGAKEERINSWNTLIPTNGRNLYEVFKFKKNRKPTNKGRFLMYRAGFSPDEKAGWTDKSNEDESLRTGHSYLESPWFLRISPGCLLTFDAVLPDDALNKLHDISNTSFELASMDVGLYRFGRYSNYRVSGVIPIKPHKFYRKEGLPSRQKSHRRETWYSFEYPTQRYQKFKIEISLVKGKPEAQNSFFAIDNIKLRDCFRGCGVWDF